MKIVSVAIFAPDTNYTRDLSVYFQRILGPGDKLYLCGRADEVILDKNKPRVDHVWRYGTWRYALDILSYVRKKRPDVVHLQHEFKTYGGLTTALLFPVLMLILKLEGYPVVVTVHGVVSRRQVDFEFLDNFNVKPSVLHKYLVLGFFSYIYASILFLANRITVHAPMLKKTLNSYLPPAKNKIRVIDHGIREIKNLKVKTMDKISDEFPITRDKKMIVVFGHFSPRKGYEHLIDAYKKILDKKKLRQWLLALVGDVQPEFQPYWDKIVGLVDQYNLKDKVLMTGFVRNAEIDEFFRNAKIVLIPAIVSFNTSGALSLALAYKKPLLVANIKPLGEEIRENNFGLLYDMTGKNSLENQLGRLMENKKLYESLSTNLEKTVGKRYWTVVAKKHYELYQEIVS